MNFELHFLVLFIALFSSFILTKKDIYVILLYITGFIFGVYVLVEQLIKEGYL